jgi:hypothetical protein
MKEHRMNEETNAETNEDEDTKKPAGRTRKKKKKRGGNRHGQTRYPVWLEASRTTAVCKIFMLKSDLVKHTVTLENRFWQGMQVPLPLSYVIMFASGFSFPHLIVCYG